MSLSPKRKKINPDGVAFEVDLERFTVGTSMFIPCIDTKKAIRQLER